MTLTTRKRYVAGSVLFIFCLANAGVSLNWLAETGLISWAQRLCDRFVTGTAITVIAAMLIIVPPGTVLATRIRRCRVCDTVLLRRGKYCSECGSRV